ncbi:hypothetical protein [Ferrimonas gelatinilytica]|uniref:Thioesterase family protein n=1 Tax=Ferrimonas gelatinilytica TaxID=1255257 RepID=A0ABP9S6H1_9GAMM
MTLVIDPKFNGPDGSGNGGYCAGQFAQAFAPDSLAAIRVRLCSPPPLGQAMTMTHEEEEARVWHGETEVARLALAPLALELPRPCSGEQAEEARERYPGFVQHAFPRCYVCGPERAEHDGLRIFAGAVEGERMVAAPFEPFEALADPLGFLKPEQVWAALDCPSYFAAMLGQTPTTALLGTFTVQRFEARIPAKGRYRICAWPLEGEGRKRRAGAALFDHDDRCLAAAEALWILLPGES